MPSALTLPLILGVLGGTSVGTFIGDHKGLVNGLATGYFIAGTGLGLYLLSRRETGQGETRELPTKQGLSGTGGPADDAAASGVA